MPNFSPSTIKLWPVHRLRRKKKNIKGSDFNTGPLYYSIVGTVIIYNNKGSDFNTGRVYYSLVGTVIIYNKASDFNTGPLYYSIVGTVIIIKAVISILGHYTKV